jgi:hypothetical protein
MSVRACRVARVGRCIDYLSWAYLRYLAGLRQPSLQLGTLTTQIWGTGLMVAGDCIRSPNFCAVRTRAMLRSDLNHRAPDSEFPPQGGKRRAGSLHRCPNFCPPNPKIRQMPPQPGPPEAHRMEQHNRLRLTGYFREPRFCFGESGAICRRPCAGLRAGFVIGVPCCGLLRSPFLWEK